jgi:hypothetical protein
MTLKFVKVIRKVLPLTFDSNDKRFIDYIFTNALKEGFIVKNYQ